MARKFMISFLIILFVITFTNSLPTEEDSISLIEEKSIDKRQATQPFYVLYADFEPYDPWDENEQFVTGRITFTKLPNNDIRVTGQCNTGFTNPDPSVYTILIVPNPICPSNNKIFDLTPFLKYYINPPGTSAFEHDFSNSFTLEQIHHNYVIVKMGGTIIGAAFIQAVGDQ